ncbi:MAG: AAA family ATPase [Clostridia bacterium]|nr:AAA family ATPase [Clostridia bacterium]
MTVDKYLNPGNGKFQESLDFKIYVDKSGLIEYTNSILSTKKKYICVSRPRRFGKTVAAEMLESYYSRGCDSHVQFDGLKIAQSDTYEKYLNKYNVIHCAMTRLLSDGMKIEEGLAKFKMTLISNLMEAYPEMVLDGNDPVPMFSAVYGKTKVKFVFIFDEWDCVFRERKDDTEGQGSYLNFLRDLFKDQDYVALAYMTGILPIKKYGSESALNMFTEISMTNASPLQKYTGFTRDEVETLCAKYNRPFNEFEKWYDGYTVNGEHIYNPKSVVESLGRGVSDNYWTQTQSFESLKGYIEENTFGIHEAIISMLAGGAVEIDTAGFKNDMVNFNFLFDILTLLVHLGYLTYDFDSKTVSIPNHEIESEFRTIISEIGWESYISDYEKRKKVLDATLAGDEKTVAEEIAKLHRTYPEKYYNNEVTLSAVLKEAFSPALKNYRLVPEMPAGGGLADYILIPNKKIPDKPLIVTELKSENQATADGAIAQIKRNHYSDALSAYTGEVLLVGISYDTAREEHLCVIEKTEKTK